VTYAFSAAPMQSFDQQCDSRTVEQRDEHAGRRTDGRTDGWTDEQNYHSNMSLTAAYVYLRDPSSLPIQKVFLRAVLQTAVSAGLSLVVLLAIEKPFMCISGHLSK